VSPSPTYPRPSIFRPLRTDSILQPAFLALFKIPTHVYFPRSNIQTAQKNSRKKNLHRPILLELRDLDVNPITTTIHFPSLYKHWLSLSLCVSYSHTPSLCVPYSHTPSLCVPYSHKLSLCFSLKLL
jgi:hypothetical protein